MEKFYTNTVVIGAGVVGLAIAKEISAKNNEVIILEKEGNIGQITSSRNSGVIHAGMYYQSNSLKAKLCVEGNRLLYAYAKKYNIPVFCLMHAKDPFSSTKTTAKNIQSNFTRFFETSVPTDQTDNKKIPFKRGRFFIYKYLFLIKTKFCLNFVERMVKMSFRFNL